MPFVRRQVEFHRLQFFLTALASPPGSGGLCAVVIVDVYDIYIQSLILRDCRRTATRLPLLLACGLVIVISFFFRASRRPRAASSVGSSLVSSSAVARKKRRTALPSSVVMSSSRRTVSSEWGLSFARACQSARYQSKSETTRCSDFSNRSSMQGIMHCTESRLERT